MLFPSLSFAAFFVAVYFAHVRLSGRPRAWKSAMLAASYVFYGWWDWRLCGLLAASTVLNWVLGLAVAGAEGGDRRAVVGVGVVVNLATLGLFKYYGFFVDSLGSVVAGLPAIDVVLPIGISFYTFQAISYVVDVHRRLVEPRPLLDVAVFLAFFPQLVAGPIVRASELLPQLATVGAPDRPGTSAEDLVEAAWLIGRGLFKKVVIASYLAETVVDPVYAAPTVADRTELLLAFYGYAIQIYADFSGYTDMAIGIALLLGFRFPSNFDNPYRATSVTDFWRRWHQTLSRWLRDYLYIPLGGNRGATVTTYRNLLLTMVLGGLWHGAAWTFVVWGVVHGLVLVWERLLGVNRSIDEQRFSPATIVRWAITFHVVGTAWVVFRAPTLEIAGDLLAGLATAPAGDRPNLVAVTVIAVAVAVQLAPTDLGPRLRAAGARLDPTVQGATAGLWLATIVALWPAGVAPFIYFQF